MDQRTFKSSYHKKLEISFIVILLIMISLFYFGNMKIRFQTKPQSLNSPIVTKVVVVPRTRQVLRKRLIKPVRPVIPVPADEPDLLEEVTIPEESVTIRLDNSKVSRGMAVPPRQILESIPQKPELVVKGSIELSIKIGADGHFKTYKILRDDTGCTECLQNILEALHKSRWTAALVNGQPIEYWLNKTYIFK